MKRDRTNAEPMLCTMDVAYNAMLHAIERNADQKNLVRQGGVAELDVHLVNGLEDVLIQVHERF